MPEDFYAINLRLSGRLCLVVGGGPVAARKTHGLLANRALVRLVSPDLAPDLAVLADKGEIAWLARPYQKEDLTGAVLAFAATGDPVTQEQISRDGEELGVLVNRADDPSRGDFHLPASIRQGALLVTISTSGQSPALSAVLRRRLEQELGDVYAPLTELCGRLRPFFPDRKQLSEYIEHLVAVAAMPPERREAETRRILTAVLPEDADVSSLLRGIF
ncbi:MAG: bifunctional precorrin-2 dehydrogenase/sirohydrochlorin ferrochelatase [Desulfobulbaceae bacterium]|jgi:siroheme synthase-like protein|nr:bifunctional precorrin-2 dehydrogenase/sirohydrochlorin ferrochelatase [Desulfobulbaceae bacterium]